MPWLATFPGWTCARWDSGPTSHSWSTAGPKWQTRLARFQHVKTHPDHRNRGLAGTLIHRAGRDAFDDLGAERLVMVADPDYLAIRLYRSLGFTDAEPQVGASRLPPT